MASEDPEIESIIDTFCELLSREKVARECLQVLLEVKCPESSGLIDLKLGISCPTYNFRKRLFRKFIESFSQEHFVLKPGSELLKTFCNELGRFIDDESVKFQPRHVLEKEFRDLKSKSHGSVDFTSDNTSFNGVVVRRSDGFVWILSCNSGEEFIAELDLDSDCPGHGITAKIGDVLTVVQSDNRKGQTWTYECREVECCYYLEEHEIRSFLDDVLHTADEEGPPSAMIELVRCAAVWDYILGTPHQNDQHSQQFVQEELIPTILDVCYKVCSVERHASENLKLIWKMFARSKFLEDNLQQFIRNVQRRDQAELAEHFLKNFLKVCPEYTRNILPIIKELGSIVERMSDDSTSDFLCQLLENVASSVPGVEALTWKQQPLIPAAHEFYDEKIAITAHLPKIKVKEKVDDNDYKYSSVDEYLNTYFTLMREECFHKLKNGIRRFLDTGEFDPKDIMMYSVKLSGIDFYKSSLPGLPFVLKFCEKRTDKSEIDWEASRWLMYGDLLCISLDVTFKKPIWALVCRSDPELTKKGIVYVTLCSERNSVSDAEVISELQRLADQGLSAYMAESNTFYRAYGPSMDVLQQKDTVPFKEYLVDVSQCEKVPYYIKQRHESPDWKVLFPTAPNVKKNAADYYVVDDFKHMRDTFKCELDESQLNAVEQALTNEVVLIQGPPGTGKSYVGVALVNLLLSMDLPGPILVVTYKNFALDHFLESCEEQIPQCRESLGLIRVGAGSSDKLDSHKLYEIARDEDMPNSHYKFHKRLTAELKAMEKGLRKAFNHLRQANIFDAMMFVKEADDKHIKSLVQDDETCDQKRLEELIKLRDKSNDPRNEEIIEELAKNVKDALQKWLPSVQHIQDYVGTGETEIGLKMSAQGSDGEDVSGDAKVNEAVNTMVLEPSHENKERLGAEDITPDEAQDGESTNQVIVPHGGSEPCKRRLPFIASHRRGPHFKSILNTGDIWKLDDDLERIHLIYALRQKYYENVSTRFMALVDLYSRKKRQRQEITDQHNINILKKSKVVGMTVTGAAIRADWLEHVKPSVMIVEEAAEILESQLVSVIPSSVQHLIMIGDHQQLRPQIHYDKLRRKHNMDVSLFERLIKGGLRYTQLKYQGRMRDEFADILRELRIYDDLKTREELVKHNTLLPCMMKAMYFITHKNEESMWRSSHSFMNEQEAQKVVEAARYLLIHAVQPSDITILCSYRGQVSKIQSILNPQSSEERVEIEVTTIDSFQGRENEVILLSLVRSNRPQNKVNNAKIGYLSSRNRICVAISRARRGLYIFGDSEVLKTRSKDWRIIINKMKNCQGWEFPIQRDDVRTDGGLVTLPRVTSSADPRSVTTPETKRPHVHVNINSPTDTLVIGDGATVFIQKGSLEGQCATPEEDQSVRSPQGTQQDPLPHAEAYAPTQEEQKIPRGMVDETLACQETESQARRPTEHGNDVIGADEGSPMEGCQETGDVQKLSRQETEPPVNKPVSEDKL